MKDRSPLPRDLRPCQGGVERAADLFRGKQPVERGLMLRPSAISRCRSAGVALHLCRATQPILHPADRNRSGGGREPVLEMHRCPRRIAQVGQRDIAGEPFKIGVTVAFRQEVVRGQGVGAFSAPLAHFPAGKDAAIAGPAKGFAHGCSTGRAFFQDRHGFGPVATARKP